MLRKICCTIIFLLIVLNVSYSVYPQDLPDYSERILGANPDSLISSNTISITATEGSINPDEYKVGPGDKIFISITGVTEIVHSLVINQEGWLYIPKVGGIDLRNHTLRKAKERIIQKLNEYYKDVNIFISLADFRRIKVSLTGDVVKPSIFTLSANSRLLDLINSSMGLKPDANMRNIKIISRDGTSEKYDFLSFLRFGNFDENPVLREGDVVIVDKVDKTVKISGEIKYPAVYEFVDGETVLNLINLAGGFLSRSKTDTIEVVGFSTDRKTQFSVYYSMEQLNNNDVLLNNKDHVIIRRIPEYLEDHYILITGFVKYPGYYKIIKDKTTLKEIIEEAGGFREEASLTEASIKRTMNTDETDPEFERLKLMDSNDMTEDEYDYYKAKSRQNNGKVVVDFVDLFINNNMDENIVLRNSDVITVPEKKDYIIMLGQFLNPGKIIYDPSLTVDDYIDLAGGFGWRAIESEVRVIKATTGEWIDADDVEKLEPGDTIWVPEEPPSPKFWEIFMNALTIVAQLASVIAAMAAIIIATR